MLMLAMFFLAVVRGRVPHVTLSLLRLRIAVFRRVKRLEMRLVQIMLLALILLVAERDLEVFALRERRRFFARYSPFIGDKHSLGEFIFRETRLLWLD